MSYLKSLKKLANVLQITSILANGIYQQPSIEIKEYQNIVNTTFWYSLNLLPNRPFHLILNQAIQFNGVFHWQFFCKWLNKAHNDHFSRFLLTQPTTH